MKYYKKKQTEIGKTSTNKSNNIVLLGFPIILFDVLDDDENSVRQLLNIGNVVILRNVYTISRSHREHEAALYYPHPPSLLHFLRRSFRFVVVFYLHLYMKL